jgi:hypothetical protein
MVEHYESLFIVPGGLTFYILKVQSFVFYWNFDSLLHKNNILSASV